MEKIAIITGATSGIGKSTAIKLAESKFNLIITGRRNEKLVLLKSELENRYGIKVYLLCFDIRNREDTALAIKNLPTEWKSIDVLINNAGLAAGLTHINDGDIDDWEQMIDTNIKGLLYISRQIMPIMIERGHGHIVNISSIAGKEVYENGNVYCATKHSVEAITKAMRTDLLEHGIKVSSVSPGAVETEFSIVRFKGDKQRAKDTYNGYTPLQAEDVADAIQWVVTRPEHVNINDILIMPKDQANSKHTYKG